ncbi:Predicted oxidoreductase [Meinhardsimonia xiamenensis]|jgi:aryl-alcohol dehydrogenase-like predicted oxidoreductase|uniref:Predicted oxidoreductase n=1 Tax=Meinhardsimonia xiamenensis TaxID=990712 RepID=A0A1G9CRD8_9RHOB|nr:aldo/keto reductase [Meinhardsimonia xiamenensis]PRX38273.1 aryl-alcohol dehydrogenase-like predicted oxidoreductase [Meinhardsimonia xiamenensis]SDK54197.1 Predicted oxidoreductase [Meinhardsimonia xiamenensis]
MDYITLGTSDLKVSRLCLGSMNWGSRNTAEEAHRQIDRALAAGINFIDTAEIYPTYPIRKETAGLTEEIIGDWFARTGRRGEVILATKAAGKGAQAVRDGAGFDGKILPEAIDGSLRRLKTDFIDLYQLHWPARGGYHMRRNWSYDPSGQDRAETVAHMVEVLEAMDRAITAGKVRWFGLSNETTWGTALWLRLAEENGLPRPITVQNEYSLLCRFADLDLAELCVNENVHLLPYSPLAMGLISGKYGPDRTPPNTRRAVEPTLNGRVSPRVWPAVDAYRAIAEAHGLDVNAMALAWTLTRPFVGASIFGASTDEQLETALSAAELELSDEVLAAIAEAHKAHPMPF